MRRYLLAHDLGTSGNKATLFTTDGKLVGVRHRRVRHALLQQQLVRAGAGGLVERGLLLHADPREGCRSARDCRHLLQRPDDGLPLRGQGRAAAASRHPVQRPARDGAVRRDTEKDRRPGVLPHHRSPGQRVLLRGEAHVGEGPRARGVRPDLQDAPRQGLPELPAHRRDGHRVLRRVGHQPAGPEHAALVGEAHRRHGHRRGEAARPEGVHRRGGRAHDGGCPRDGAARGHPRGGRRRGRRVRGCGRGVGEARHHVQLPRLLVVDRDDHEGAHLRRGHADVRLGPRGARLRPSLRHHADGRQLPTRG